eukprot:scaffold19215_cov210-Isochrysis_galbana.AAC.2
MGPDPRLGHVPMHSSRSPRSASVLVCVFLFSTKITIPPPNSTQQHIGSAPSRGTTPTEGDCAARHTTIRTEYRVASSL